MSIWSFLPLVTSRQGSRPERRSPAKMRARLCIEPLEDRQLLCCGIISGFVYYDVNNNGIMDPGEIGLANNQGQLKDTTGNVVATTGTESQGFYKFQPKPTARPTPTTQKVHLKFSP